MVESANTMKNDAALRREFAEMVEAAAKCAAELSRPWKITTGILAAAVIALTLLNRR